MEPDALGRFTAEVRGPVNLARLPQMPSLAELAVAGVARVSWGRSRTSTRWLASGNSSPGDRGLTG
jgi:2-methylisocitrate lyase-like PEP mutase family enzyme